MPPAPPPAPDEPGLALWAGFFALVVLLLAFDLLVVHRKAHAIPFREALLWSVVWTVVGLAFNGWIWWEYGDRRAAGFFAAYVTERALSFDNLFVFVAIFSYFRVAPEYRHRVLFWGILGALAMRGVFLWLGMEILEALWWSSFLFGAVLLWTAWKLLRSGTEHFDPAKSLFYRLGKRLLPLSAEDPGGRFFVRREGRTLGTTLLLVLVVVEGSDVLFALDSVPACLGIVPDDLFVVYTSNVFAILGLRALYFLIEGVMTTLPGLQAGLSLVLAFVGLKMIGEPLHWTLDPVPSMAIIVMLLVGSWAVAALARRRRTEPGAPA